MKKVTASTTKKFTKFRPRIKSRHPSHDALRKALPLFPFKSVIRLGSTTDLEDSVFNGGERIEINTIDSIKNSANKLRMKKCFSNHDVTTADWAVLNLDSTNGTLSWNIYNKDTNNFEVAEGMPFEFPIVAKNIYGSRGVGNYLIQNQEELDAFLPNKIINSYIFERFYNYNREYRLHVTKDGCFYTCRKMLKSDTPENQRWFRNNSNSVWIVEENPQFDRPVNWDSIVEQSVNALNSVGLDIGAVDVKVQSAMNNEGQERENPKFIVLEINSAASFGRITEEKYLEELPKILNKKHVE